MVETYIPFDSGAGASVAEDRYRTMARHWQVSGCIPGYLNELEAYGDSSGMQIKLKTGSAWIYGHSYENTAERTIAVTAADPANPRIDRLVLEANFTTNIITAKMVDGTAAATPAAPALTQTAAIWQIPLAQVYVDAAVATIAVAKVTNERMWSRAEDPEAEFTLEWVDADTMRLVADKSQRSIMPMAGGFYQGRHLGFQRGYEAGYALPGSITALLSSTTYRLYGSEVGSAIGGNWYAVFARPVNNIIELCYTPFVRISADAANVVTPGCHNAAGTTLDYNWSAAATGGDIIVLTGASRGAMAPITALTAGAPDTLTYGGQALALVQGVLLMLTPPIKPHHYLGAVFNDNAGNLVQTRMSGRTTHYATRQNTSISASVAQTTVSLATFVPPTARFAQIRMQITPNAAGNSFQVRWYTGISWHMIDGTTLTRANSFETETPLDNTLAATAPLLYHATSSASDTVVLHIMGWRE